MNMTKETLDDPKCHETLDINTMLGDAMLLYPSVERLR